MKFNEFVENLSNYEAGKPIELVVREFGIRKQDVLKLASNENPFGTSEAVQEAIVQNAACAHLYPDDSMYELKGALASKFGVEPQNIIIGAGSDQIIEFALHAKLNSRRAILQAGVTFAMYGIYTSHCEAKVYKTSAQEHDLAELLKIHNAHRDEISVIFLCVPNNPLGECLDAEAVYKFVKCVDENTLVVIDAAYNEFAAFKDERKRLDPKLLIQNFKNVLYLGTFSKVYGLGGMRVGYGIAPRQIINALYKLRPPFNITTLSLAAAIAALKDEAFVQKSLQNNAAQMSRFEDFARERNLEFIPSYANFITFKLSPPLDSSELCERLLRRGIIIRNLKSYGLNAVRITIGTQGQNDRVLGTLGEILSGY